jgi:hypothetical protein
VTTIIEFSQKAHDRCIALLDGLQFDGRLHKDGLPAAYLSRLIELFGNFVLLAERLQGAGAPAIFRSFLEASVEFTNLTSHENYYRHIYARFHEDRRKLLKSAERGNPYLEKFQLGFQDSLRSHEESLLELTNAGFSVLKVRERFERAGMLYEYESIYRMESNGAHSDLAALMRQNLEVENQRLGYILYREWKPEEFDIFLMTMCDVLLKASRSFHSRLRSDRLQQIDELDAEWTELKTSIFTE